MVLASPRGGPAPVDPRSTRELDAESRDFLSRFASSGAVRDTLPLYRVNPDEYEAIFFAGGHGAMWDFPEDDAVQNVAEQIYANGGVIGAVCHGPAALVNMNAPDGSPLVKDRRVAAFTNEEEAAVELTDVMPFLLETRLREQGARFIPAANFTENVVTDGTLVTGQNPASARAAAEAVVRTLRSGE